MKDTNLITEVFKDKFVATIAPSLFFAKNAVFKQMDFSKDSIIVEYGPGTGAFTKDLLKKMTSDSKLILVETNKELCLYLKQFADDRVVIANESAQRIPEILGALNLKADYVISGIPFSMFDEKMRFTIIKNTKEIMKRQGKFIVYQFMPHCKKPLQKYFRIASTDLVILNIPPFFVYVAKPKDN